MVKTCELSKAICDHRSEQGDAIHALTGTIER
jgi:hypothetical protein